MTAEVKFRSDMTVDLIDHMGDDHSFARAARVSTGRDQVEDDDISGLINFLAKNRHGSPFEHAVLQWRIEAPIFVWREFHRHRIASYNEESSRYKQLDPVFYVPGPSRNLTQVGRPGHYEFVRGTEDQEYDVAMICREAPEMAYAAYEAMLARGIAREVARIVLPVSIYSACYVTMNVRALTNFLSLRTKDDRAMFPSFPQREIEMVAEQMEIAFRNYFPLTWNAWCQNGRVPL